ncbi:MAG: PT repeat/fibro-slime domain-containing protein, partial [Acidimicrobiaceae bacterium]
FSPAAPVPGEVVTLTAQSTGAMHASVRWQQLFGRPIALSSQSSPVATFRAPAAGPIGIEVASGDFTGARAFAQTTLLVVEGPVAPVARVTLFGAQSGPSQVVRLDGSASSGWGLTYAWSLADSPATAAALSSAGSAAYYRASVPGSYVFRLTVTDSLGRSAGATASIAIVASPPVARILSPSSVVLRDATGHVPDRVTTDTLWLDGSGSFDPAGAGAVSYSWTLISTPPQSSVTAAFPGLARTGHILRVPLNTTPSGGRLPDAGSYTFALTVTGAGGSASTRAEVAVVDPNNLVARSDAGPDRSVFLTVVQSAPLRLAPTVPDPRLRPPGNLRPYVTLDGRASGRIGQGPLAYAWSVLAAPAGAGLLLSDEATPLATFATDLPGDYSFGLVVNDGLTTSATDVTTLHVEVIGLNAPPVAEALAREAVSGRQPLPGRPLVVVAGTDLVELDATRSTDRDDPPPLTYRWTQTAGQPVELLPSSSSPTLQFVPPAADSYAFRLVVRDARGATGSPATVQVDAQPAGRSPFGRRCDPTRFGS